MEGRAFALRDSFLSRRERPAVGSLPLPALHAGSPPSPLSWVNTARECPQGYSEFGAEPRRKSGLVFRARFTVCRHRNSDAHPLSMFCNYQRTRKYVKREMSCDVIDLILRH